MMDNSWKDIYRLPLKTDEFGWHYVFSDNGVMAMTFDFDIKDEKLVDGIVGCLNGKHGNTVRPGEWNTKGCDVYCGDGFVFSVRGWGHLTGCGGLNLPHGKAVEIQDGFVEYILGKLNEKTEIACS